MKTYNMIARDVGLVIEAENVAEAMEKAEEMMLQGWGGYIEFCDEEDIKEYGEY